MTATIAYLRWPQAKAAELIAGARNVSRHDDYPHSRDVNNCGACALRHYTAAEAPNYAGWLRIYIALGWAVPRRHYADELAYAQAENQRYYEAIQRDIATWGIELTA